MGDYKKLDVWHKSHELACELYRVTGAFPAEERFGLADQIRRAAVSVGANIAEGCGRDTDALLRHHLGIALGSINEVNSLLDLAAGVQLLSAQDSTRLTAETERVRRMLAGLINALPGKRARAGKK